MNRIRDAAGVTTCLTITEFERYEAGLSDEAAAKEIREHLDACDACRVAYEKYRQDQRFIADMKSALSADSDSTRGSDGAASDSQHKKPGHTPDIAGYRIIGVLGHGGMGIVYRAVQNKLNRMVALKVLPAMVGAASPSAVSRFRREATAAARLHHTHIVPIYDFGECHDAYYYAMELIAGQPLNVVIKRFAQQSAASATASQLADLLGSITSEGVVLPPPRPDSGFFQDDTPAETYASVGGRGRLYYRQVARWIADAAEALHYAHGQGIIHRDIKPANLILSCDMRIMIADFGLAKCVDEESVTMTGALLGTVRYLSPEQAMARRVAVDHRTDIYSLGATMYELLCFQPAFPGNDDKQVLSAIITRDPARPRKIAPSVPPELETICLKTLEKAPDYRYPTARAFADDLRRYVHDLPIVAKRPGPIARTIKFVRRHKVPVIAAALILLVTTVGSIAVTIEKNRTVLAARKRDEEELRRLKAEVESLVQEGMRADEAQDIDLAVKIFERVTKQAPNHCRAWGNLATLLKKKYNRLNYGDRTLLERAMRCCEKALATATVSESATTQAKFHNLKGVLLKMLGRYDEALDFYNEAIVFKPSDDYAWENVAVVYALRRDLDTAEQNMRRATQLVGSDRSKDCETSWRSLASLLLYRKSPEASAAITQTLDCAPGDPWSLLISARIQLQLEGALDYDQALLDADYAFKMRDQRSIPFGRFARRVLALAHLRTGRLDRARQYALEAIDSGDVKTLNHLIIAIAERKLGHAEQAHEALDRAKNQWPVELTRPGDYLVDAPEGVLWFETADELLQLQREAVQLGSSEEP